MAYVDYEFYNSIYGEESMPETDFNRFLWESQKRIDRFTFGKLKFAFPTNEDDAESVKRCLCALVEIAYQIDQANKRVEQGQGYVVDSTTGDIRGKAVSSVSSGSESVSYTAKSESGSTVIDAVLSNKTAQNSLYRDTVKEYLGGVNDANGVPLLYAGIPYPRRL